MTAMTIDDTHPFVPPTADDSRSPCPALNALANHGFLPHDGRALTASQLISTLRRIYNLSWPLAALLTLGGIALCGHQDGWSRKLDLHELAKHNVIEHNGSLVHDDAAPGQTFAPTSVDLTLLHQLLNASSAPDALTLQDLCKTQVLRKAESGPLRPFLTTLSRGEVALLYHTFSAGGRSTEEGAHGGSAPELGGSDLELVVPKGNLEQWLGHESLPADWNGPERGLGMIKLAGLVWKIKGLETKIKVKD